jgi:hypothetical protein
MTLHRRHLLQLGLGLAGTALTGCGGGGGGEPAPAAGPATGATGRIVYRNSGTAGVWDLAAGRGIEFDPGSHPLNDPGMAVSAQGIVTAALDNDNQGFGFATFDLEGRALGSYRVNRELAFQTGAVVFDGDGTRIAFSVNEPVSATDDNRIPRTLVVAWPGGNTLAAFDGHEDPQWLAGSGELFLMESASRRLRVFDAQLRDQGFVADLVIPDGIGTYAVSADGRFVVIEDFSRLDAYDRQTGARWKAAERISNLNWPCLSPDGRFLAAHAIDVTSATPFFWTYIPHVFPFAPGLTVQVDSEVHRLVGTLAATSGRMGWVA